MLVFHARAHVLNTIPHLSTWAFQSVRVVCFAVFGKIFRYLREVSEFHLTFYRRQSSRHQREHGDDEGNLSLFYVSKIGQDRKYRKN